MKLKPPPPEDEEVISDTERWRSTVIDKLNAFNVRLMRVEIVIYLLCAYLLGLKVVPVLGNIRGVPFP